jgi:hypothetical protein
VAQYDDLTRRNPDEAARSAGAPTLDEMRGSEGDGAWRDDEAALRRDMDVRRERISDTVNQIEYRVRPDYIWARRRASARQRLTGWKDAVFGNDDHGDGAASRRDPYADDGSMMERGRERGAEAAHVVGQAPTALRRQTRGNPLAAGAVALGAGWLIGSLLPESRTERQLAAKAEPRLAEGAAAAKDQVSDAAHSVEDAAREAAGKVQEAGRDAAHDVANSGKDAARSYGGNLRADGSTQQE